ncbi:MAG TPA: prolipoprotein diacylglyceryl transferase [Hyphomicrobiaceae bacterium]|nr:prolipoprotein diacylglyceryl transferase [Hyphomicrobiaceae bacterium]
MTLFAIPFPNIDPTAFSIGPVSVKWYGLAYAAGLLLGWLYVRRMLRTERLWNGGLAPFPEAKADDLLLFMTIGVVVGGRLGEVLFYQPGYFLANPLEIFATRSGGMSFHGGFVGSILAIWFFSRRNAVNVRTTLDLCAAATPIGLFFGRITNFINAELWGKHTDVPWAMVFPGAGPLPRHPSQLYEAALEGAVLFLILAWLVWRTDALKRPGLVAGAFTAGYGIARSFCELFREADPSPWAQAVGISPGTLYSLPMIVIGIYLIWQARSAPAAKA